MLDILATFTVVEKITLLAWHAQFQASWARDNLACREIIDAADDVARAVATSALIGGLCTGCTTDEELLDFVQKQDFPGQLEFLLDCRTQQELEGMGLALVAAFQLCVRLGLLDAWEPWEPGDTVDTWEPW